jgi:small-conductance mechanosensitive channel
MEMLESLHADPRWSWVLVLACLVALAAVLLHALAHAVLTRVTRHSVILECMMTRTQRAATLAAPLLALQVVWQLLPDALRGIDTVRHVNGLMLIGALTWLAIGTVGGLSDGVIRKHPVDVEDNLHARRIATQTRVLGRSAMVLLLIGGVSMGLMTFPGARQLGASLLASAGVLGLVVGIAARPVFSNLIAGLQLALGQPLRIDDALIVKGEFGRVEEITGTYVVLKLWDERRMIVPLQWFIENPFENWTRTGAQLLGSVLLWVDYATPMEPIRAEAKRLVESFDEWDGRVFAVQVTDGNDKAMQVRILVSAASSGKNFDLRCKLREGLVTFLVREYPRSLPVVRNVTEVQGPEGASASGGSRTG